MSENHDASKVENMKRVGGRVIKIQFNADTAASMRWNFKPQQYEIKVMKRQFHTAIGANVKFELFLFSISGRSG